MVRSKNKKNTGYKTNSDLKIFSQYLTKEKEKAEISKRYLLVILTRTLLLHDSSQTNWRQAVRFVFGRAKVSKEHPKGQWDFSFGIH